MRTVLSFLLSDSPNDFLNITGPLGLSATNGTTFVGVSSLSWQNCYGVTVHVDALHRTSLHLFRVLTRKGELGQGVVMKDIAANSSSTALNMTDLEIAIRGTVQVGDNAGSGEVVFDVSDVDSLISGNDIITITAIAG